MKRFAAALLAAALCLCLAACREQTKPGAPDAPAPAVEPPAPAEETPLRLDALNVEFSVGERDTDMLLALQRDFPQALIEALGRQKIEVGSVAVTFGTSGEATETALKSGAVQLAFLSAEEHYPYRGGMIVAAEQAEADPSLGLIVSAATDDAAADERFASAMRAALPDLAAVLAPYTSEAAQGRYAYDAEQLGKLAALCEPEEQN